MTGPVVKVSSIQAAAARVHRVTVITATVHLYSGMCNFVIPLVALVKLGNVKSYIK